MKQHICQDARIFLYSLFIICENNLEKAIPFNFGVALDFFLLD